RDDGRAPERRARRQVDHERRHGHRRPEPDPAQDQRPERDPGRRPHRGGDPADGIERKADPRGDEVRAEKSGQLDGPHQRASPGHRPTITKTRLRGADRAHSERSIRSPCRRAWRLSKAGLTRAWTRVCAYVLGPSVYSASITSSLFPAPPDSVPAASPAGGVSAPAVAPAALR